MVIHAATVNVYFLCVINNLINYYYYYFYLKA